MNDTWAGEIAGDLDEDALARIKSELDPGERLLWTGRPRPKSAEFSTAFKVWGVIGLVLFLPGAISWVRVARNPLGPIEGPLFFWPLCGAVAVFILLVMLVSRKALMSSVVRAGSTLYAVSDRRAMAWIPGDKAGSMQVFSFRKGAISVISRVEHPDGSGDVVFAKTRSDPEMYEPLAFSGFQEIENVRRVEEQVRRTLLADRKEI